MAATAINPRQSSHTWSTSTSNVNGIATATANSNADPNARQRFQYGPPASRAALVTLNGAGTPYDPHAPLPPRNDVEMTRDMLVLVLNYFSQILPQHFDLSGTQSHASSSSSAASPQGLQFVVHGGACMLLHPGLYALSQQQQAVSPALPVRTTTRDVDYIHRGFMAEYGGNRLPDAAERLKECIRATARWFNLGADWMNSDADIALPMAHDPSGGKIYDPIYTASIQPHNINLHTIYRSPNGLLALVSVTPFWAVSLKLVRYTKWDPGDICLLLRNGTLLSNTQWSPETLEGWLYTECWAMGYAHFDARKKAEMRSRIEHAIQTLAEWNLYVGSGSSPEGRGGSGSELGERGKRRHEERGRDREPVSAHDAMGGGTVVGGEFASQHGWGYSFGASPGQPMPGMAPAPGSNAVPMHSRVNVRDWGSREKSKSRNIKSREPSRSRSSRNSPSAQEIFIPPNIESDSDSDDNYPDYYDHARPDQYYPNPNLYDQPNQSTWIHLNPNHAPVTLPPALSRAPNTSSGGATDPVTAAAAWHPHSRALANNATAAAGSSNTTRVDPYAMDNVDEAVGAISYEHIYGNPQGHGQTHGHGRTSSMGFQPVIPTIPIDVQQQMRKKKEKQRKKDRQRARVSKWDPRRFTSETDSDDSETDSDDEDNKENRDRERRARHREDDTLSKRLAQGRPWHQIYAAPRGGDASSNAQVQQEYQHYQDQPRQQSQYQQQEQPPQMRLPPRTQGQGRPPSRPMSRNPSPNPDGIPRRRPPPLDLTPPPVIPNVLPQTQQIQRAPPESLMDPAQLAQYQFEQQQKNYQVERVQHQILSQREQAFYQHRQLGQAQQQHQHHQQPQRAFQPPPPPQYPYRQQMHHIYR